MKYKIQIILLLVMLIPQLISVWNNWHSQMYMGNWVEMLFLEFTLQTLYHYITKDKIKVKWKEKKQSELRD